MVILIWITTLCFYMAAFVWMETYEIGAYQMLGIAILIVFGARISDLSEFFKQKEEGGGEM